MTDSSLFPLLSSLLLLITGAKGFAANLLALSEILHRTPRHERDEHGAVLAGA